MSDGETGEASERPEWWEKNQRLREEMELPDYEPPRFEDGVYTHEVITRIEGEYDCDIAFRAPCPHHPCEWEVRVDGECVGTTARRRTDRGNTVYRLSSRRFRDLVESAVE